MSTPDLSQLESAARKLVHAAQRDGTLHTVTPHIIRQKLEQQYSLDEGTLDAKEFKKPLNLVIRDASTEATIVDTAPSEPALVEPPMQKTKNLKRKSEEMAAPKPKVKRTSKLADSTKFKSSAMVPSSDVEEDIAEDIHKDGDSSKENQASPAKKRTKSATPRKESSSANQAAGPSTSGVADAGDKSDSELSVLDDDPPKPKKQKARKSKDVDKTSTKSSKAKKTSDSSPDEETIKRLKSLILACGVRKVWAKLFKDVEKPSQQIRMLKQILEELGMTGRLSLEKAKAIKEKRELAQELEDVQAFAAAATKSKTAKPSESEEDEEEEEEEEKPAKRKTNAHRSIMAFLEDQSDED